MTSRNTKTKLPHQNRMSVMPTRPTAAASNLAQQRPQPIETIASASGLSSSQPNFKKPSGLPIRKPVGTKVNVNKCQYCDKSFVKVQGMTTHLLEKCEKIPASVRRQLLQKNEKNDEKNSKQVSRRKTQAFRQEIDSISKYSRFFVNLTNEPGQVDVANGLTNLRAELRKVKSAHTGVVRTPNKSIRCHICNKLFLDCVKYADHSANHPSLN